MRLELGIEKKILARCFMMNKDLCYRWCIFFIGMIFVALSIALFVKCALGTTPIASVAYVLSLALPFTVGEFKFIQFLQLPITFVFCALIDFLATRFLGYSLICILNNLSLCCSIA